MPETQTSDTPARRLLFGLTPDIQARLVVTLFGKFRTAPCVTIETCEDALQKAVLKAETLNPCVNNLEAWLTHVASNHLRDHIKRPDSDTATHVRIDAMTAAARDALFAPLAVDPLGRVMYADALSALREHMAALPERQRRALWLHDVKGVPFVEVAARLGISEGCAKMAAVYARRKLQKRFLSDPRTNDQPFALDKREEHIA